MKQLILILLLVNISKIHSQKIEKRIGDICIMSEGYFFDISHKNKKRNVSKKEYYFKNNGQILEIISYRAVHSSNLKKIGDIEQYFYNENKLDSIKSFSKECDLCEYDISSDRYIYDKDNKLISSNNYSSNNSLFMPITYIHKPNIEEKHFNSSTYYESIYDANNKIIEFNQRFEDTKALRWQYTYKYLDNSTVIAFQTYYHDKMDRTEFEIKTYSEMHRLISSEKIGISRNKKEYVYSKDGFLKKIFEYRLNYEGIYELERLTKFKVITKEKYVKPVYLKEILATLLEDE